MIIETGRLELIPLNLKQVKLWISELSAFKGTPNHNEEIEIGYGLGKDYEHNGYMTEAVKEMCKWGLKQEKVKHIIAETDLDGYASQRVLKRNRFEKYKFEDSNWWRL